LKPTIEKWKNRRSIRLRGYDYTQSGAYFVTICTQNRECLFGDIVNGKMVLNEYGKIVVAEWKKTAEIRDEIELDEWVVMPNHFHGIVVVTGRGTACRAPTIERFGKPVAGSLPTIVRSFKSAGTKCINTIRNMPGAKLWQRNYYEHVIRNENELNRIQQYIINNPDKWESDRNYPIDPVRARRAVPQRWRAVPQRWHAVPPLKLREPTAEYREELWMI